MSRNTARTPRSYEEIVRRTIVEPDSSVRPTLEQEQAAREGFRALDTNEQALQDRVVRAIQAAGVHGVTVEISRDLVTLRGEVPDSALLRTLEDIVANVSGVTTIHDQVVVSSMSSTAR
jgi:osmotically-inducible protein OsmY